NSWKTRQASLSRKTNLPLLPFAALGNRHNKKNRSFISFLHLPMLLLRYTEAATVCLDCQETLEDPGGTDETTQ
ncbi:hypothetical protein INR49_023810, partial [Caranx melampygus]